MFLFVTSFLFWMAASAQVANLSVNYDYDPNAKGEYVYQGKCKNRSYWVGPKGKNKYAIVYKSNSWGFGSWTGDTTTFYGNESNYSTSMTLPLTGWMPWLQIELMSPKISYSLSQFSEVKSNDGHILDTLYVSHNKFNGQTFSGSNGSNLVADSKVATYRIPAGLTLNMVKQTDTLIKVYFTGTATNHSLDTNFSVKFLDAAFANGGKADSTGNDSAFFKVNFRNAFIVAKTGGDFTTVTQAVNAASSGDIITIKAGVYTENNITVSNKVSELTFNGEGADKTIIQADSVPFKAVNRVFTLNQSTVEFHDLTIQHGNVEANNAYGGGIYGGVVYLYNCRVTKNRAFSLTTGQTIGGGIQCTSLYTYNSEISDNIADNGNKSGQIMGGGVYCSNTCMINSTTISGNYARTDGGGIILGNGVGSNPNSVINSTIANNTAETGKGGGICTYGINKMINTISWGNTAAKGKDIYQINGHVYPIYPNRSVFGDVSGISDKSNIVGTYISADPKLDTLKYNCSNTRTHALMTGSSALDSGAMADSIPTEDQRGWEPFLRKDIGSMEMVYQVQFEIGKDTICMEDKNILTLTAKPSKGVFEGEGVVGNTFDVSKITKSGYVVISYKYTAPGCGDFSSSDSIYVKVCTPSKVKNFSTLSAKVYPNPANDQVTVVNYHNQPMNVTVFDLSGKSLLKYSVEGSSMNMNVKTLPAGLYIVEVESNGLKSSHKLIKN